MTESERNNAIAAVALVVGAILLALSVPTVPKAFKIAFDLGAPGMYVVGDVPECSFRCYSRAGTFTSDDGKITRSGVHVRNGMPRGLKQGDTIRAFDIGTPNEVFSNEGQNGYPSALPIIAGLAGLLGAGLGLQHVWAALWTMWKRRGQSE